jgi:HK97 family phage major capsid protein
MKTLKELRAEKRSLVASMQVIVDDAQKAGRDITAAEGRTIAEKAEQGKALNRLIEEAEDRVDASNEAIKSLMSGGDDDHTTGVKSLALTGSRGKSAATGIAVEIMRSAQDSGQKAFPGSGAVTAPTPLDTTPLESRRVPTSLLDLLRVKERQTTTWAGIRQTGFTNNASIVPAGALKPTSTVAIENTDGYLAVIAHLSEAVDKYLLVDNGNLAQFIQGNLLWGLKLALEDEVFNGDGSEFTVDGKKTRHFTGILGTTGVQQQAFAGDAVSTLRSASTKLETIGFESSAYVLNPLDWERIETARNVSGQFDLGSAVNRAQRKVWDTQVVTSTKLAVGTALALDLDSLNVDTDTQGIEIRWDGSGQLFDRNQIKARVEGRFGFSFDRPEGAVVVDLTAGQ